MFFMTMYLFPQSSALSLMTNLDISLVLISYLLTIGTQIDQRLLEFGEPFLSVGKQNISVPSANSSICDLCNSSQGI